MRLSSGIMVLEAALLGLIAKLGVMLQRHEVYTWSRMSQVAHWLLRGGLWGAVAVAILVYSVPTVGLMIRSGRWRVLRVVVMLAVYPVFAGAVGGGIIFAVYWVVGYVVLAVRSMTL